jgi:copper transport protein
VRWPAARGRAGLRLAVLALAASGAMTAAGAIAAPAASAHAVLVASTPVDGSRVNAEPAQVRLTFDEPVGLIAADEQVISATGVRADTGQVRLAEGGTTIVLPLRPHLPRGTYSATWRVVSADTHVVSGSITFGLGVRPGAGVAATPDHTGQLDITADIAEGLIYAGLVLLAGITAAARLLWPWTLPSRRVRGLAWAGWAALTAGTAAEFALQGPRAVNASWAAVFRLRDAGGTLGSPRRPPGSRCWSRSRSPDTKRRERTWPWRCPPRSCTWRQWRSGSAAWWCSGSRCCPRCAAAQSPTRACGDGR